MRMAKSKRGDAVGNDDDGSNSNNNNHTAIFALAYESFCRASAPDAGVAATATAAAAATGYRLH